MSHYDSQSGVTDGETDGQPRGGERGKIAHGFVKKKMWSQHGQENIVSVCVWCDVVDLVKIIS